MLKYAQRCIQNCSLNVLVAIGTLEFEQLVFPQNFSALQKCYCVPGLHINVKPKRFVGGIFSRMQ